MFKNWLEKAFEWIGFKLEPKDLWPLVQLIAIRCFKQTVYEELKNLARKAEALPELAGKGELEKQLYKWQWVVKEFVKAHDEKEEWDADLSLLLNIAIKEIKGKIGNKWASKLKPPKWLRF